MQINGNCWLLTGSACLPQCVVLDRTFLVLVDVELQVFFSVLMVRRWESSPFVTLHHKMSRIVPDGLFNVLYFLKVKSMLFTMVKPIFKSED